MKRIEAIMDKNMADINAAINLLAEKTQYELNLLNERIDSTNERIDHAIQLSNEKFAAMNERIDHLEKSFNEKIEHTTETLSAAINAVDARITDMKEELKHEQNKSLTKFGIFIAIAVGIFQAVVSIVLHFLG